MVTPAPAVMTLTLAEMLAAPDLPPEEAQRIVDSIVCWGEETPALRQMTRAQWERVLAEWKRIGRPLEADEVLAVLEAADAGR